MEAFIEVLIEQFGDDGVMMLAGLCVGLVFGAAAQHSRFCLRASIVETAEAKLGGKLAIWLLAFSAAVLFVQLAILLEYLDASQSRQLSAVGSMSGAIVGGVLFGVGMILSRGCASRLLVLSATGNLRALVTGLVLTLVAQASLRGVLSPVREAVGGWWLVDGGEARNLLSLIGLSSKGAVLITLVVMIAALGLALKRSVRWSHIVGALLVGFAVALGWGFTYQIAQVSFEPIALQSVTFTGPSTDTLMTFVNQSELDLGFGVGLVPGVFIGAALMSLVTGDFEIQRFGSDVKMERYLLGAFLMGFGAMLAGGCAVGAGMTGGSIFAITAWVAVFSMWMGGLLAMALLEGKHPFKSRVRA
ncbi:MULTISPECIES: YeeE/YedE family protein [Cohaesibacter]|uniref:YeeE/YedE family protein n=1 Tax=Cohaesibacter TaxID=655352 RepID=UPI000DE8C5CA|nr:MULTISPECIES: YeeE/YedE family protein [Cohaesibacter]TLP46864.1 YeeE/YedE family protein [Cohaesibacter sp. CAU 1516]